MMLEPSGGKGKEEAAVEDLQTEGENIGIRECNVQMEGNKKVAQVEETVCVTNCEALEAEGPQNDDEDIGSDSSDMMSTDDSDLEDAPASGSDEETKSEVPLTDAEIEELVAEFLEVESKAAEAQESLEEESLARVQSDVREELSDSLHGDALEMAVSTEMKTFKEEWEAMLDDLETQSSFLLEQLDGAGIELPSLYKWIESQAPNGCCTEAWKKRAHWVGSQITSELNQSIRDAESSLQLDRPVRRQHGKLLEEGASGYLAKKFSFEDRDNQTGSSEKQWSSFNELLKSRRCINDSSFGSKNWACVYLASTPQQAANLGFDLPGVNEVEEIGELECISSDPLYADAIANEKEIDLSEEQKRNFRTVREEDDAKLTRKLQRSLTQQRQRSKIDRYREKDALDEVLLKDSLDAASGKPSTSESGVSKFIDSDNHIDDLKPHLVIPSEIGERKPITNSNGKRTQDTEGEEVDNKRGRTVIIDIDDEEQVDKSAPGISHSVSEGSYSPYQVEKSVNIIDVDALPSPLFDRKFSGKSEGDFVCTACYSALGASEVRRHPRLQVIVCESCRNVVEKKVQLMDSVPGGFCGWCGMCIDLLPCNSCPMLFCITCVSRNFGEEILLGAKASGWQCCCCSPDLLHQFVLDCERALESMVSSCESGGELSDDAIEVSRNGRRRKKRIRRILDDAELGEETKQRVALEKARQEHLRSMQLQSASKSRDQSVSGLRGVATDGLTVGILGDSTDGYIVNLAREEDEEPVRIPPSISTKLKPHQVAGIRFMWENIIQSVKKVKSGDKGLGCILAHTMGLGKTFQVITFLYAAMRSVDLGLKTALVVTPVNVLHNWRQEFIKWKPVELKPLRVLMLDDVGREKRAFLLEKWRAKGGVLLMGYAAFRNLSFGRHVKDKNVASEICYSLQNGPDILVCDEAHMIKNTKADITLALRQVKTQRRIALTGSPLQNNLMEYYCMVDFVRERFLGSSLEFRNRFQNPIENGQHTNSTAEDVKLMNERSHILYQQLKGFIHRMDVNVVKNELPPKTVFVISVKLSPLQRKLYKKFLDAHGFTSDRTIKRSSLFKGYQALAQIWNHPGLLQMAKEHKSNVRKEDSVENFLMDDSSSEDNVDNGDALNGEKQKIKDETTDKKGESVFFNEKIDWWKDIIDEKIYKTVDYSGKMVLLLDILSMSSKAGEKALVFSQSLTTLDMIEQFLSKLPRSGTENKYWKQGKDWYRLDGSTDGSERQRLVERFNDPTNQRVKCTLISTRAGSLGINLHAANRVVLVDGSWNPTHDLQAIFRVWRYGQNKPVYAYRLMAHGTMEEKIYKRQVTKEGLAARVVDRQQVHRTMSKEEILHLFDFGGEENADILGLNQGNIVTSNQEKSGNGSFPEHKGTSSSDKIMECLLSRHQCWIASYHEHESLLQENEAERLTKEEQELAWQTFQRSLEWEEVHRTVFVDDYERKPAAAATTLENNAPLQNKGSTRNQSGHQRKCSNLDHMLTLRSQDIKSGKTTVCGQCSQEFGWEDIRREARSR